MKGAGFSRDRKIVASAIAVTWIMRNDTMKAIKVQTRRPQFLLTFGAVLLTTGLILGSEPDPATESGQPCEAIKQPADAAPMQSFKGNSESFAPTVKKVAPAVVRIVTALRLDGAFRPGRQDRRSPLALLGRTNVPEDILTAPWSAGLGPGSL